MEKCTNIKHGRVSECLVARHKGVELTKLRPGDRDHLRLGMEKDEKMNGHLMRERERAHSGIQLHGARAKGNSLL